MNAEISLPNNARELPAPLPPDIHSQTVLCKTSSPIYSTPIDSKEPPLNRPPPLNPHVLTQDVTRTRRCLPPDPCVSPTFRSSDRKSSGYASRTHHFFCPQFLLFSLPNIIFSLRPPEFVSTPPNFFLPARQFQPPLAAGVIAAWEGQGASARHRSGVIAA